MPVVILDQKQGEWRPACGGTEVEFQKNGMTLLYVYQPATGRHGYWRRETDMVYADIDCTEVL